MRVRERERFCKKLNIRLFSLPETNLRISIAGGIVVESMMRACGGREKQETEIENLNNDKEDKR